MDATKNQVKPIKSEKIEKSENIKNDEQSAKSINSQIKSKSISQMTAQQKSELPLSDKIMVDAIEKANKAIAGANRKIEYSIHEKTKEIMVKVINTETNEIIREIPSPKILDMVANMWEKAGILVDERG